MGVERVSGDFEWDRLGRICIHGVPGMSPDTDTILGLMITVGLLVAYIAVRSFAERYFKDEAR